MSSSSTINQRPATNVEHPANVLKRAFWRAVEEIGQCWSSSLSQLSDDGLAGYTLGVKHTLTGALEQLQMNAVDRDDPAMQLDGGNFYRQLDAALGEQLRRRHPGQRWCQGRKLNEFLTQIRDWRLALIDGDDRMFGAATGDVNRFGRRDQVYKLERALEQWMRSGERSEEEETLARQIEDEARALRHFYLHLVGDREWFARVLEKRAARKSAEVQTSEPIGGTPIGAPETGALPT